MLLQKKMGFTNCFQISILHFEKKSKKISGFFCGVFVPFSVDGPVMIA